MSAILSAPPNYSISWRNFAVAASVTVLAVLIPLGAFLFVYRDQPVAASMATVNVLAALTLCWVVSKRMGFVSFSALSLVFYLWFLGIAPILRATFEDIDQFAANQHCLAYIVALAGVTGLGLGALFGSNLIRPSHTRPLLMRWGFDIFESWPVNALMQTVAVAAILYSISSGYFFLGVEAEGIGAFAGAAAIISSWMTVAYVAALRQALDRPNNRSMWRFLAFTSFVTLMVVGALSLSKYQLFLPLGVVLLTLAQDRAWGKVSAIFVSVVILYAVVSPIVEGLRVVLGGAGAARAFVAGPSSFDIGDLGTSSVLFAQIERIIGTLGRGIFDYFSYLVNGVGTTFDYLDGFTYLYGLRSLVPFLEKGDTLGFLVGRTSGYLPWTDALTNLSPTNIGEHYINFGFVGVLLGMFVTGLLYVWLDRRVTMKGHWSAIYILLFVNFNEGLVGQSWFTLMKSMAVSVIVFLLVSVATRHARTAWHTLIQEKSGPAS